MAVWLDQYKQSWTQLKRAVSSTALDTITTRFLILFLFAMAIPLSAVIIFTVSLLIRHVDAAATQQLLLSRSLFVQQMLNEEDKLNALLAAYPSCAAFPGLLCQVSPSSAEASASSNAPGAFGGRAGATALATDVVAGRLYVLARAGRVTRGAPLDADFLNRIYRHHPELQTQMIIVSADSRAADVSAEKAPVPSVLAQSPNVEMTPELQALLPRVEEALPGQPTVLGQQYTVLRETLFSARNLPVAHVLYVLPLAPSQTLLSNYYAGTYIITVAGLLLAILLAMLAGRTITQPLLRLIRQVNTLSRATVMQDEAVAMAGVYEIRQLAQAFNRMVKRLAQEHKMKDEFVATLTHDLKVPLLAEKQTLSYFRQETYGPLSPEQTDVLTALQSSNQSCLGLVNGLLQVYRYDSGEVALMMESFSLPRLLQETVGELQALAQEKSIGLDIQNHLADASGEVYADPLEIKRVLHNLISNAITNTPAHGQLQCGITDAAHWGSDVLQQFSSFQHSTLKYPIHLQDRLLVSIQDSGVGFSTEDLPGLFKQFAACRGRNPMSIGLGLYNCYQVVSAHHGVLWVETTEGQGSAVNFVLPVNRQTARDRRVYYDRRKQR